MKLEKLLALRKLLQDRGLFTVGGRKTYEPSADSWTYDVVSMPGMRGIKLFEMRFNFTDGKWRIGSMTCPSCWEIEEKVGIV